MKCKPSLLMGVYCIVLRGLVVAVMSKRLRKQLPVSGSPFVRARNLTGKSKGAGETDPNPKTRPSRSLHGCSSKAV